MAQSEAAGTLAPGARAFPQVSVSSPATLCCSLPPAPKQGIIITGVVKHKTSVGINPAVSPVNGARRGCHSARPDTGWGFEFPPFPFADPQTLRYARGCVGSGHSCHSKPSAPPAGRAVPARAAPVVFAFASDHLRRRQRRFAPPLGRLQTVPQTVSSQGLRTGTRANFGDDATQSHPRRPRHIK